MMQRRNFLQALGTVSASALMTVPRPETQASDTQTPPAEHGLDFHTFREYPGQRGPKTMLFWDYWKLHHMDNVELVPGVPALVPEATYIDPYTKSPGTGRVFFDRAAGKWKKIWGASDYYVAESDDGIHWRPADYAHIRPAGTKKSPHHVFSLHDEGDSYGWLYLDPLATDGYPFKIPVIQKGPIVYHRAKADPQHRWHELTKRFDEPRLHMFDHFLMVSRDGLHWEERLDYDWGQGRIVPEEPHFMFFNHLTQEHSLICRPGLGDRRVCLTTTKDFVEWSEPRLVQAPDLLDGGIVEFYTMPTFAYGQYFIGFVWGSHFATSDGPDFTVLHKGPQASQLAMSLDGQYFVRPVRQNFIPFTAPGELGCHSIRTEGMVVLDDEIRFYSDGGVSAHGTPVPPRFKDAPKGCLMHRLRRDGFMSFQSKGYKAEFTTRPLVFYDPEVTMNAQAVTGRVEFEIRDTKNRPVTGYTFDDCQAMRFADSLAYSLRWKERQNLGELVGKCLRLAVRFHNAQIYSFRGDYHFIDAFDQRRIDDGLAIDTTRFGA
jgi:hypothetical protein